MFSADLSTRRFNGCAVVALRGELDLADAAAVTAALSAVAARDPVIVVDLAGLEFIDSSGVAALARGRTQARRAGGDLVLAAPQRKVMRVLAIIRLSEGFSVYATVKQAGRFRERAVPVPRHPGRAHRAVPDQWPGTRALTHLRHPHRSALRRRGADAQHRRGRALPGGIMRAVPGDRVLVRERRAGEGDREAVIIEVWSERGGSPYADRMRPRT
jgi:anti-sigma B factor antagonist